MKVSQFKNIIKECVREVLKEELKVIIHEELSNIKLDSKNSNNNTKFDFTNFLNENYNNTGNITPVKEHSIPLSNNPLTNILREVQQNMSAEDKREFSSMGNFNTSMLNSPIIGNVDPDINPSTLMNDNEFSSVQMPSFPLGR